MTFPDTRPVLIFKPTAGEGKIDSYLSRGYLRVSNMNLTITHRSLFSEKDVQ